jgi:hypothetical protein
MVGVVCALLFELLPEYMFASALVYEQF